MKQDLITIGLAGFLGSIARYLVYVWLGSRNLTSFPWATLVVNLVGCLVIGIVSVLVERAVPYHRQMYLAISVGFLGAFTTFSAFGLETFHFLKQQNMGLALLNIILNLVLGLGMVFVGRITGAVI